MRCEHCVIIISFFFHGCMSNYVNHNLVDLAYLPSTFKENATTQAIQKFKPIVLKQQKFSVMQHVIDSKSAANQISSQSNKSQIIQQTTDAIYKALNESYDNYRVLEEIAEILKIDCLLCENGNSTPIEYLLTALIYIELTNDPNHLGKGISKETTWWTNYYYYNSDNMSDIILKILQYIKESKCHGDFKMDLWFLLDGMESTTEDQFQSSLNFTSSLASKFNVTKEKVQVGCSLSSYENNVSQYLNDTSNLQDFQQVVSEITKPKTHVESYSETIDDILGLGFGSFPGSRRGQSDVHQTLVMFNDDQSIGSNDNPIQNIQGFNLTVFEFLIGKDLNESEISCLSENSNSDKCNFVSSYYDLADEKYQDLLTKDFCSSNYSAEEEDIICVVACDQFVGGSRARTSEEDANAVRAIIQNEYNFDCASCRNYSQEEKDNITEAYQNGITATDEVSELMDRIANYTRSRATPTNSNNAALPNIGVASTPPGTTTTVTSSETTEDQNSSTQNRTTCEEEIKADIWLVVNLLKETNDMDFETLIAYISNITEKLQISSDRVRLGLSFYSVFLPARHYDYQSCGSRNEFQNILSYRETPPSRSSMYEHTLDYTLETCFSEGAGARPVTDGAASRHIVLLTDGETTGKTFRNETNIRAKNVTVTAISVGNNNENLNSLVEEDEDAFNLPTYYDLNSSFVDKVFNSLCHLKNGSSNIETDGGIKQDLEDVIRKYEDFQLNFTKVTAGKAILYLKISSPTDSSVSFNYRIVLDTQSTGVLISPEELIKKFPSLSGEKIIVSYSIVSSVDVVINKSRNIRNDQLAVVIDTSCQPTNTSCKQSTANQINIVSTEENGSTGFQADEGNWLIYVIIFVVIVVILMPFCFIFGVLRRRKRKVEPDVESQLSTDDLERIIAEAKVNTSAPLLKKLQEKLKSDSSFDLTPDQLKEAYEVLEDLKSRIDEITSDLRAQLEKAKMLEDSCAEDLLKQIDIAKNSDLSPALLAESEEALARVNKQIEVINDLRSLTEDTENNELTEAARDELKNKINEAQNLRVPFSFLQEPRKKLRVADKEAEVISQLEAVVADANSSDDTLSTLKQLQAKILLAETYNISQEKCLALQEALESSKSKMEENSEDHKALLLSGLKEADEDVKNPSVTVSSFNNLKAELKLAEALGVSEDNLKESYGALNNMKDSIDKVKQKLAEATENCKQMGANIENLKKLEEVLKEAEDLDLPDFDTAESYDVVEDMKNRIEDVMEHLYEAIELGQVGGYRTPIESSDVNNTSNEKANLALAIEEASDPSDFVDCIKTLQKRIDANEALGLPEDQLTLAYSSMDALKKRIEEARNNLHENAKSCEDPNADINNLLKLQRCLKSAEDLNFSLSELIDSYETAKNLQGRIIGVKIPKIVPVQSLSSHEQKSDVERQSSVSESADNGAPSEENGAFGDGNQNEETQSRDSKSNVEEKSENQNLENHEKTDDDKSLDELPVTLLPAEDEVSDRISTKTEIQLPKSPRKSRSNISSRPVSHLSAVVEEQDHGTPIDHQSIVETEEELEETAARSEASAASKKSISDKSSSIHDCQKEEKSILFTIPEDPAEDEPETERKTPLNDEPCSDYAKDDDSFVKVERESDKDPVEENKSEDETQNMDDKAESNEMKDIESIQEDEVGAQSDKSEDKSETVQMEPHNDDPTPTDLPVSEENSVHEDQEEDHFEDEFEEIPDIDVSMETMSKIRSALRAALSKMDLDNFNLQDLISDIEVKFGKLSSKDIKFIEIDIERYIVLLGLQRSVGMRSGKMLRSALARKDYAFENKLKGYNLAKDKELTELISKANDLLLLFEQVERMKSIVMQLKQPTISEVRSYAHPPAAIRNVMEATFILLGDSKSTMQSWDGVKKLIGKTGKEALKRRIWERDLEEIPIQDAEIADALIVSFQKEDVEVISKAASVFYSWSKCVIQEARDRQAFKTTTTSVMNLLES